MYALPGRRWASSSADLDTALGFQPPHLSIYHLTLEPNTAFANAPPVLPDEDTGQRHARPDRTAHRCQAGLERYEVSAFARPGHRCAHNLNYWQFGDYLGIGAGAHGKLSFPAPRAATGEAGASQRCYMAEALAGKAVSNEDEVARKRAALRVHAERAAPAEGFELPLFTERTGLPPTAIAAGLAKARERGPARASAAVGRRCGPPARLRLPQRPAGPCSLTPSNA
jgi:coproporphyrinogen III oxidase-like Fe-S oxidoreductase